MISKRFLSVCALVGLALCPFARSLQASGALAPAKPSDVKVLSTLTSPCFDTEVLPDGSFAPFSVPAGKVLVLTGLSWSGVGLPPHENVSVQVLNSGGDGTLAVFFTASMTDADGRLGGSALIPNAVVEATPCFFGGPEGLNSGLLHAFLAEDK